MIRDMASLPCPLSDCAQSFDTDWGAARHLVVVHDDSGRWGAEVAADGGRNATLDEYHRQRFRDVPDREVEEPFVVEAVPPRQCHNCGAAVSDDYHRVFSDNDGLLHACPACGPNHGRPDRRANP